MPKSASKLPVLEVFFAGLRRCPPARPSCRPPPQPAASERERAESQEPPHQYVRSIGCHFVTVTGFQSSFGAPSTQRTSVCRM